MEQALKNYRVLMGVAALAVIAFVGVSFWDRWQAHRASELAAEIASCDEAREMARLHAEGRPMPYRRSIEGITANVAYCDRNGF